MVPQKSELSTYQELAVSLRTNAWNIVENWIADANLGGMRQDIDLPGDPERFFNELPTLIGGISRILDDPERLADIEPGGNLYRTAGQFGEFRHETGQRLEDLIHDLNLFRRKLWSFCQTETGSEQELAEVERRVNKALDRVTEAAICAYHERAANEMLALSRKDKLTGLLHRGAFDERLKAELERSKRYRHTLSLIRIDIDDFRNLNIAEGRLSGNELLEDVAAKMAKSIRRTDEACRISGDDFAVIMPETAGPGARNGAERIRQAVRRLRRGEKQITVSIGIATHPEFAQNSRELIEQAETAMERARRDGGDVVAADQP